MAELTGPRTLDRLSRLLDVLNELARESHAVVEEFTLVDVDDREPYARISHTDGYGNLGEYFVDFEPNQSVDDPPGLELVTVYVGDIRHELPADSPFRAKADSEIYGYRYERAAQPKRVGTVSINVTPDPEGWRRELAAIINAARGI